MATIWRGVVVTAITAACAIIAFAPSPGWAMQEYDGHLHFAAFAVITLLAVTAFPRIPLSHMLMGLALLGGAIEFLQFTPGVGRQPDLADFGFNLLGIDCALILAALLRRLRPHQRPRSDAAQDS
jgi:hypothetical protein